MKIIKNKEEWESYDKLFPAFRGHRRELPKKFPVCVTNENWFYDSDGPDYYVFHSFAVKEIELNGVTRYVICEEEIEP